MHTDVFISCFKFPNEKHFTEYPLNFTIINSDEQNIFGHKSLVPFLQYPQDNVLELEMQD